MFSEISSIFDLCQAAPSQQSRTISSGNWLDSSLKNRFMHTVLRITIGHDQEARFTRQRLHCPIGVSVLPYMAARHAGTGPFFTPAVFRLVDPSETSFILEHQTHFSTISSAIVDFRLQFLHFFFDFFEVSMTSSPAFFGCLLRGIAFLQPCRRST